jgi:hypothetical protein
MRLCALIVSSRSSMTVKLHSGWYQQQQTRKRSGSKSMTFFWECMCTRCQCLQSLHIRHNYQVIGFLLSCCTVAALCCCDVSCTCRSVHRCFEASTHMRGQNNSKKKSRVREHRPIAQRHILHCCSKVCRKTRYICACEASCL